MLLGVESALKLCVSWDVQSVQSRGVGLCWELGSPLHWGACLRGWGGHSLRLLPPPPSQTTQGIAFPAPGASRKAPISSCISPSLGPAKEQHLSMAVPSLLFVWYIGAVGTFLLILWLPLSNGDSGALSSISGLVGELNKMVRDAGAAPEKIFVSRKNGACVPALCNRQAGAEE